MILANQEKTSFLTKKTYCSDLKCKQTKGVTNYVITETVVTPTIPKEGDKINNERAIGLCEYFGYTHLVKRIKENPNNYKEWDFDGVSGFPDDLHFPPIQNITKIALKHDLKYAYGKETKSGKNLERLQADKDFYNDLINNQVTKPRALIMYSAVRMGGSEKNNPFWWRWGFARKNTKLLNRGK